MKITVTIDTDNDTSGSVDGVNDQKIIDAIRAAISHMRVTGSVGCTYSHDIAGGVTYVSAEVTR